MDDIPDELNPLKNNPLGMFVLSVDTLHQTKTDQTLSKGWSDRPPLFTQYGKKAENKHTLKVMCRKGIPPALRSAIWITSVVRNVKPDQPKDETDEYGTLMKVRALDHGWDVVLKSLFSNESDELAVTTPDFGLGVDNFEDLLAKDHGVEDKVVKEKGLKYFSRVLYAARQNLGFEYAPLLPDLTALLLSTMPESYAYATLREMSYDSNFYFPTSSVQHNAWCKTFGDIMKRMYPQTARAMEACGALSPTGLDPIFRRFFITILERKHVMRIMDIYTVEGYKVLFRVGTALLCLSKAFLDDSALESADAWWAGVRNYIRSDKFQDVNFDVLIKQAYGFQRVRLRRRTVFPRRRFISKLMEMNEKWAKENSSHHDLTDILDRPLGYVEGDIPIVLAKDASVRLSLADFLPFAFKTTKIELIYSSSVHGRSINTFYQRCSNVKHSITLMEVLQTGGTIGMFATDTWRNNPRVYGDGECAFFRISPNPVCYNWTHAMPNLDEDESYDDEIENEALLEQIMISRSNFISMGGNKDGTSGLRLNEDLTKGSSAKAVGFNNEPLVGNEYPEFDVGLVEVYRLVREIDGKSVDGDEDPWKHMFD